LKFFDYLEREEKVEENGKWEENFPFWLPCFCSPHKWGEKWRESQQSGCPLILPIYLIPTNPLH